MQGSCAADAARGRLASAALLMSNDALRAAVAAPIRDELGGIGGRYILCATVRSAGASSCFVDVHAIIFADAASGLGTGSPPMRSNGTLEAAFCAALEKVLPVQ